MRRNSSAVFNLLSAGFLGLTIVTLIAYTIVLVDPHVSYNPFPPAAEPETPAIAGLTTPTLPPTWTPRPTSTPRPTNTPRATYTPTGSPSPSPTWPPTFTPTPRITRSAYPFTCEVQLRRPEYDAWSGLAGHVQDIDGNPLPGYYARVECPGVGEFNLGAGEVERYNLMYGSDAAWEQACNPIAYQAMEVRFQLFNNRPSADGTYRAVSEQMSVELPGYMSASLGYVVCTLNWEEWH